MMSNIGGYMSQSGGFRFSVARASINSLLSTLSRIPELLDFEERCSGLEPLPQTSSVWQLIDGATPLVEYLAGCQAL